MDSATVKIPGKLFRDMRDRGAIAEAPNVAAHERGNRVSLTGPAHELAYLGDCIWQYAQSSTDPARDMYSAAKLLEIAARFPHAPAEPEEAPNLDADTVTRHLEKHGGAAPRDFEYSEIAVSQHSPDVVFVEINALSEAHAPDMARRVAAALDSSGWRYDARSQMPSDDDVVAAPWYGFYIRRS